MKKKILIVDDEPQIVRLLSMRFKGMGFEVFEAFDGLQCVTVAEVEMPDLILSDIKMPNMDGIAAFEKLLQMDTIKKIPVIFMTAYPQLEVKNQVTAMGAKAFVSKPMSREDLKLIIEAI